MAIHEVLIGFSCAFMLFATILVLDWCKRMAPQTPYEQYLDDEEQWQILTDMQKEKHNEQDN